MTRKRDNEAHKLRRNTVQTISYRCATPGPDIEESSIDGFWTGDIDTWGKRTIRLIRPMDGCDVIYLFDREVVTVDDY